MFKYYFIKNKLVYFDVDIADQFQCSVNILHETTNRNKLIFITDTIFEIDSKDVKSIQIVQGRIFTTNPEFAYTQSAVFILSLLCGTQKSIEYSRNILQQIEDKEQFDLVKTMSNLSVNSIKDTSESLKKLVRYYVAEVLNDGECKRLDLHQ